MKYLYENGSWGIGFSSSSPVTGIVLAIVWLVEAGIIIGASRPGIRRGGQHTLLRKGRVLAERRKED